MFEQQKQEIFQNIQQELSQINQSGFSFRDQYLHFKRLLERACKEVTVDETLQFPSLFSRLVFIAQKYKLPNNLEQSLHQVRVVSNFLLKDENTIASEKQVYFAHKAIHAFLHFLIDGSVSDEITELEVDHDDKSLGKIRVQITDIQFNERIIICRPKDSADFTLSVKLDDNHPFLETFHHLWQGAQLNLIDCKIDGEGFYLPSMLVLEPDYLIDASAIAECFQNYGNSHLHYFRRKFEAMASTHYILLGNLANFFLDELIYADDASTLDFNTVFLKSFKEMPFEFTACKDIEEPAAFRQFMIRAKQQFKNIQRVVLFDLHENGFSLDKCILEPSFFSEKYGFQGRLDMLQLDASDSYPRIIELKSGKTPWPQDDVTQIAANHETQTSVYRLMIQSVFGKSARQIHAMILYSSSDFRGQNLRLFAPYKQLEKEIVNLRNRIVATEHNLYMGDGATVEDTFSQLFDLENYAGRTPDFFQERLAEMKKVLHTCTSLERTYFYRFVSFISRELYLLKMGDEAYDSAMSTSALWSTSFLERKEALELVSDLTIDSIEEDDRDMKIRFKRQESADFVNFREGEICIVYPRQSDEDSILSNQIMKGTVIEITAHYVLVRFRYKQRNRSYFNENKRWVIEHDKLDHGYNGMYKSLYAFMQAPSHKKDLLLGFSEPKSAYTNNSTHQLSKEEKQKQVIDKALAAEDYFLIVGPPGTGKTSIFARQLIERFYEQPDTNILVMAYTNRAVDELCAAICCAFDEKNGDCEKYIRIGSEYSCGEAYRPRLLQNISAKAERREELLTQLKNTRIYVGTLASIFGKPELFEIKRFDVAVIDEASQILEPQIIGLLPLFSKFIMIGDHKQLSTITLQNESRSLVGDKTLNSIGLHDCRESIFERLFSTAQQKGWSSVYETLDYHGRMHISIAELVNEQFYDNKLLSATNRQMVELNYPEQIKDCELSQIVSKRRVAFFDVSETGKINFSDKISKIEAEMVVQIAQSLLSLYKKNNKPFDPQTSLGIIAPYRNQIAMIRHLLLATKLPDLENVMVDTVERYQGNQRDVIIVSFCFNHPHQMKYFMNLNREATVDRKLNVALTRAREQLFLVGNKQLIEQHPLYKTVLSRIK